MGLHFPHTWPAAVHHATRPVCRPVRPSGFGLAFDLLSPERPGGKETKETSEICRVGRSSHRPFFDRTILLLDRDRPRLVVFRADLVPDGSLHCHCLVPCLD